MARILALDTHPMRRRVALYQQLAEFHGHEVTVLYASDANIKQRHASSSDGGFEWEFSLIGGYRARFGERVAPGKSSDPTRARCRKLLPTLVDARPQLILWSDMQSRFVREAVPQLWPLPIPWVLRPEHLPQGRPAVPVVGGVLEALQRQLYRRAAQAAYVGEQARQHFLEQHVPDAALTFSPFSIPTDGLQTEESHRRLLRGPCRKALGVPDDQLVVLCRSPLEPEHGPQRVIEAVRALSLPIRQKVTILYLGAGGLGTALKERAERAPAVDARFPTLGNPHSLSAYYHGADVAVAPSTQPGRWGSEINEALVHGVPCLCADGLGGARDLLLEGITGLTFAGPSASALAQALLTIRPLLGNPDLRDRCRDRIGRYSIAEAGLGLEKAVQGALNSPRAQASPAQLV